MREVEKDKVVTGMDQLAQRNQESQQVEDGNDEPPVSQDVNVIQSPTGEKDGNALEEYRRAVAEFEGISPADRPRLPRLKTTWKLKKITSKLNKVIKDDIRKMEKEPELEDITGKICCIAMAATRMMGVKVKTSTDEMTVGTGIQKKVPWERRIEEKIKKLRTDLNRMTQLQQGNKSRRLKNRCHKIRKEYLMHSKYEKENSKDTEVI